MKNNYPSNVVQLLQNFDCWLVGSAANPQNENPKDYDILCPFHNWHQACLVIPDDAIPNRFGGWKFGNIDLWPGDLSWFATVPAFKYAYNLRHNVLLKKE